MELRDYQTTALITEHNHRLEHPDETRLAIVLATGLGKTVVMAERAKRFLEDGWASAGQRVLILVHTDELARQAEDKIRRHLAGGDMPFTVGVVMAERDDTDADVVVASVQTLDRPGRRERIRDVGLVMVDECHHATAPIYQRTLMHFGCLLEECQCPLAKPGDAQWGGWGCACPPPTPALGLTATLERGDGASLGGVWQAAPFTRDTSWGVRHGYLVQPVGYRLEIPVAMPDTLEGQDNALIEGLAPAAMVAKWIELAEGIPTVAFMPLVRSAEALAAEFAAAGVSAGVIHGAMPKPDRRRVLEDYEAGKITVLCNAMVLTEGWDSPRTKCVMVGRPTKSRPLFIQMAGRGLRPIPWLPVEEQRCILIVVTDATTDMCTVADLSDRPIDRKAQGALTAMEDAWDIGKELDAEPEHVWTGQVDAREFDPLATRSSKVWKATDHGTPFLPCGKDGRYVFVVGTSVYYRAPEGGRFRTQLLHADLPDLELAMQVAEDEAQERGGDIGAMLADRNRPWRKRVPSADMQARAQQLGLGKELIKIMESPAGGKAGKVSDLIARVQATRALEPLVERIKERTGR